MNWLKKLFGRDDAPPAPPAHDQGERFNPLPAETAVHWSAEDQAVPETEDRGDWMEKGEPEPRRQDNPNA